MLATVDQLESIEQRREHRHEKIGAKAAGALFDVATEVLSRLVVHHQIRGVVGQKTVSYMYYVGMTQSRQHARFLIEQASAALKTFVFFGADGRHCLPFVTYTEAFGKVLFDRDFVVGVFVLGKINQTETTTTDELGNPITVEHRAYWETIAGA